ncbi:MAG: M56 family metallopeptidase [Acidobacteriota bacterium]
MERSSQLLLTFLLNACWQILLITAVGALCAWLLRSAAARWRHVVWVVVLVLSFCLPVWTALRLPGQAAELTPGMVAGLSSSDSSLSAAPGPNGPFESLSAWLSKTKLLIPLDSAFATVLVVLYLVFLSYRVVRLFSAWLKTNRIVRDSYATAFPERVHRTIERCHAAVGIKPCRVLCSASLAVPITVGGRNPVVILPKHLLEESDSDVLTSAVGHELFHIARRDYVLNLVYELIYLPLSFHPAAALVRRRIRQTRELRCDELVAGCLLDAQVYARSLVHLAGSAVALGRRTPPVTVGILDADMLEERVMTILKTTKVHLHKRTLLLVAALLLAAVPCIAAAPFGFEFTVEPQAVTEPAQKDAELAKQKEEQTQEQGFEEKLRKMVLEKLRVHGHLEQKLEIGLRQDLEKLESEKKHEEHALILEKMKHHFKLIESQHPEHAERLRMELEAKTLAQAELARSARIGMGEAIRIAMSQQAGTVMECRLVRKGDEVFYHVLILSGTEADPVSTPLLVSAIDGRAVKP